MADAPKKKVHPWSFKAQKPAAEHFVAFLYNNGHLNDYTLSKKELSRVLQNDYQPLYHWNKPQFGVLFLLLRCHLIKRPRSGQDLNTIVFNEKKIIPLINKFNLATRQNGVSPPLDERFSQPVETVVVSQQAAFRPKHQRKAGISLQKCELCQVTFSNQVAHDTHKTGELHRLRECFRNNKKGLSMSKDVSVYTNETTKEKGLETCIARTGQEGTLTLHIANSSRSVMSLDNVIRLTSVPEVRVVHTEFPLNILPNATVPLLLVYKFSSVGSYSCPIVLTLRATTAEENSFYVLKEVMFDCQSEVVDDLGPVSVFRRARPSKFRIVEGPIVTGIPPPQTRTGLVMERQLSQSNIPPYLATLLNHELKAYAEISDSLQQKLHELKSLLGLDETMEVVKRCVLRPDNYCEVFSTVLHIEEHQMNIDIRNYDCSGQVLRKVGRASSLLALTVPGLAEKRPSVLRGDSIFVIFEGDDKNVRYEGRVHSVRETEVHLGFHNSFCEKYIEGMKLHVQFKYCRYPLQVEHRALGILRKSAGERFMLPKRLELADRPVVTIRTWKNRNLENNEQQMAAVTNIVNNTSYPAPYIVFGPPGTGKTVTIVEAIVQLWDLHKTDSKKHILVCAPSNAAADVVALRLLNHIPESAILRLYAPSCAYEAVPESLRKCCNFDDRGSCYFSTKEHIMKVPIVIVTPITAGKLVGANVPAGHYSHVFIDECGHAVEPEVLVPIAGLLVSEHLPGDMRGQLVLAGDPKQLGPILRSPLAISLGLGMSFLERLMEDEEMYSRSADNGHYDATVLTKLVKNYRSHKSILAVPNSLFYHGELQVCGGQEISLACSWDELPKKNFPVIFHGVVGRDQREANSPSFFNVQEIDVILGYLTKLFEDRLNGRKIKQNEIGIVTPYRKQVEKIRAAIRKRHWTGIDVGSVEQFQGQERLIIIISTVRSSQQFVPDDYKFQLGFLDNPKRLNVALTRAKALLIVVGNPNILQCDANWHTFIKYCQDNDAYRGVQFTPLDDDTTSVNGLANGVANIRLNLGESSVHDDGPNWRGEI